MRTTTIDFKPITKYARSGKRGKHIMCPNCGSISKVYHFAWSALGCQQCDTMVDKTLWSIET